MPDDDFFESEEPTIVGPPGAPTPSQGTPIIQSEADYQRGITAFGRGLRFALLRVGVPAEEVEAIVERVKRWIP